VSRVRVTGFQPLNDKFVGQQVAFGGAFRRRANSQQHFRTAGSAAAVRSSYSAGATVCKRVGVAE
jgi:hypothetical protein